MEDGEIDILQSVGSGISRALAPNAPCSSARMLGDGLNYLTSLRSFVRPWQKVAKLKLPPFKV